MLEAAWFGVNLLVGVPVALIFVVFCREIVRAILALAFGFRVFELKWGTGRQIWAKSIGPVDLVFGRVPLAASIVAESGSPKNHRRARLAQMGGPILLQIVFVFWNRAQSLALWDVFLAGFAPLAVLHLSNLCLVGLHGLIPFETKTGFRTDMRSILDIGFGRAEANRRARASYYARYARHWLERADVARTKAILEQGLTQLGRDSLLVACEARVLAEDLTSVVDQGECADALRTLVEDSKPQRRKGISIESLGERLRQAALTVLPLSLAALALIVLESERGSRFMHDRLVVAGNAIASSSIPSSCETQLNRWARWTSALDLFLPDDPSLLRNRHDQLARLERCRGQLEAAVAHNTQAIVAAERVRAQYVQLADSNPDAWVENEVRLATLLRRAAELESDRSQHRLALVALARAETELGSAMNRIRMWRPSDGQARTDELLEGEKMRLDLARNQILTRMGAH